MPVYSRIKGAENFSLIKQILFGHLVKSWGVGPVGSFSASPSKMSSAKCFFLENKNTSKMPFIWKNTYEFFFCENNIIVRTKLFIHI